MKHEPNANPPADTPPVIAPETAPPSPDAAKAEENWNRYLRALADLDNYKKRAARERADSVQYANQSLLQKLLPVLDNFEMAAAAAQTNSAAENVKPLADGIAMIHSQLKSALAESGLEEIEASGKPFDPNFHEAVSEQESAEVPDHHVLQQLRKGYKFRDRLLRPATVIVAKKPPENTK